MMLQFLVLGDIPPDDHDVFRCRRLGYRSVSPLAIQTDGTILWWTCPHCLVRGWGMLDNEAHVVMPSLIGPRTRAIMAQAMQPAELVV